MKNPEVVSEPNTQSPSTAGAQWSKYYELTKPRVVALIMFTAITGMFLATPAMVPLLTLIIGTLGIGLAAASGAAINHLLDRDFDKQMTRTNKRPVATGGINTRDALIFAILLAVASMLMLAIWINPLTAVLTFASLIGYAVIYTVYLKHATPQNIVIGGAAGAMPPVLGWAAVTGTVTGDGLLLFLIIFTWTPPLRGTPPCQGGIGFVPLIRGIEGVCFSASGRNPPCPPCQGGIGVVPLIRGIQGVCFLGFVEETPLCPPYQGGIGFVPLIRGIQGVCFLGFGKKPPLPPLSGGYWFCPPDKGDSGGLFLGLRGRNPPCPPYQGGNCQKVPLIRGIEGVAFWGI